MNGEDNDLTKTSINTDSDAKLDNKDVIFQGKTFHNYSDGENGNRNDEDNGEESSGEHQDEGESGDNDDHYNDDEHETLDEEWGRNEEGHVSKGSFNDEVLFA